MKIQKHKNLVLKILFTAISLTFFVNTANAAKLNITRQLCDLAVFPWNITVSANYDEALRPWINKVSESVCKNHLTIPTSSPYTAQPYTPNSNNYSSITDTSDIPLITGAEEKHGPKAEHTHDYFNDSLQDDFYYESMVAKFAIDFAPDTKVNINKIECVTTYPKNLENKYTIDQINSILSPLLDCDGEIQNEDFYGGIRVEKNEKGVIWTFGTQKGYKYQPTILGKNPDLDSVIRENIEKNNPKNKNISPSDPNYQKSNFNSSDENFRKFGQKVQLTTFDNNNHPTNAWSATTTSRILIRNFAIGKTYAAQNNNKFGSLNSQGKCDFNTGWCALLPSPSEFKEIEKIEGKYNYFWFPIGTTSTVWKKTPPPPTPPTCSSLSLNLTQNGKTVNTKAVQPNIPVNISVSPSFIPAEKSVALNYKWSAGSGTFDNGNPSNGNYQTSSSTATYDGGSDVEVRVQAYYADTNKIAEPCNAKFNIPKQTTSLKCNDLKILDQNNAPMPNIIDLNSPNPPTRLNMHLNVDKDDKLTNLSYQYTSEPSTGTFTAGGTPSTSITATSPDQNVIYTIPASPTSDITLIVKAVGGTPSGSNLTDCEEKIIIKHKSTPPPYCTSFSVTAEPSPIYEGSALTILKASGTYSDGKPVDRINWSTTNGTLSIGGICATQPPIFSLSNLPQGCSVNFSNGTVGTIISASANPPATNCEKSVTVVKKPNNNPPKCTRLELTPNRINLNEQTNFTAKAHFIDSNGNSANYDITLGWTGSPGTLEKTSETKSSAEPFLNKFYSTSPASAKVTAKVLSVSSVNNPDLSACYQEVKETYGGGGGGNRCSNFELTRKGNQVCISVNNYTGEFTWIVNNGPPYKTSYSDKCQIIATNLPVRAYATGSPSDCNDSLTPPPPPSSDKPTLEKYVKGNRGGFNFNKPSIVTVQSNYQDGSNILTYQLKFTPKGITSATITDPIAGGIDGEVLPAGTKYTKGGKISYNGNMSLQPDLSICPSTKYETYTEGGKIKTRSITMPDKEKVNCYEGDIGSSLKLFKVSTPIKIEYSAKLDSLIKDSVCEEGIVCEEKYINKATAKDTRVYENNEANLPEKTYGTITSNEAIVQVFCQYILTRAAGDIFLESDLNSGIDINQCSKYKSSTGIIVVPGNPPPPNTPSTGLPANKIFSISHEICSMGQAGTLNSDLQEFYGQSVSNKLSSQICEVKLRPGEAWQKTSIANNIEENKTRIARWETLNAEDLSSLLLRYPDNKVYRITDGDLTVNSEVTIPSGARTFIIENHDLIIGQDIKYDNTTSINSIQETPSVAFIVLNGNIYIDKNVKELAGVYFVQKGDRTDSGKLYSGTGPTNKDVTSTSLLTIYGSVYGDIQPLFMKRTFAGDPSENNAAITIRFDQRIILNTPPGLREMLNLTESDVAR